MTRGLALALAAGEAGNSTRVSGLPSDGGPMSPMRKRESFGSPQIRVSLDDSSSGPILTGAVNR